MLACCNTNTVRIGLILLDCVFSASMLGLGLGLGRVLPHFSFLLFDQQAQSVIITPRLFDAIDCEIQGFDLSSYYMRFTYINK